LFGFLGGSGERFLIRVEAVQFIFFYRFLQTLFRTLIHERIIPQKKSIAGSETDLIRECLRQARTRVTDERGIDHSIRRGIASLLRVSKEYDIVMPNNHGISHQTGVAENH
jgi:hypothetical protein